MGSKPVQMLLDGTCRPDKIAKPPKRTEKVLQAQSLQTLGLQGYAALQVGQARHKIKVECTCPRCHHKYEEWTYPTGDVGNDIGTPDTFNFRNSADWPAGVFIGVEYKGQGTVVRPAQKLLADAGKTFLARSIQDAVEAMIRAEQAMHDYRFPEERRKRLLAFLKENEGHLW